jgi:hypothetical protein
VHFPPVLGAGGRVGPQAPPDDLPEQTYACQRVSVSARARRLCGCCMAWRARRGKHARTHARTHASARTHARCASNHARALFARMRSATKRARPKKHFLASTRARAHLHRLLRLRPVKGDVRHARALLAGGAPRLVGGGLLHEDRGRSGRVPFHLRAHTRKRGFQRRATLLRAPAHTPRVSGGAGAPCPPGRSRWTRASRGSPRSSSPRCPP